MPAFLEDARKYVIESTKDRAKLKLNEKSLLNWTNPTRQQERGAIYVWTHEDRPLAIGSFFTYEYDSKVYLKHEFHSLSTGALNASFGGTTAWTPKDAGIKWQDFKDGPEPKGNHSNRSLQMRQLARPFRAELIDPKGEKNELRLAPRPLVEYSSPKAGVIDGAIFSFVVATDPEVLLLIEAFDESRDGKPATGFRYAFARFHYWNVVAYDGDRRIWEAPLDKSHEQNNLGDKANISKIYNSFHPRRGEEK
ncbi:MAG: hypothetical protein IAG10_10965 [Planctomycetaceae bacterium]|nr:hypothetical protein [Planctomycetaceae bacterium]